MVFLTLADCTGIANKILEFGFARRAGVFPTRNQICEHRSRRALIRHRGVIFNSACVAGVN
jgi:hypothetical protein